jgi:putative transposase
MFVAERFILKLVMAYGSHPGSTDDGTWYPQSCRFLKLQYYIHPLLRKASKTMQYIKDRTKSFDDHFACMKKRCNLKHVQQWFIFFTLLQHGNNILTLEP